MKERTKWMANREKSNACCITKLKTFTPKDFSFKSRDMNERDSLFTLISTGETPSSGEKESSKEKKRNNNLRRLDYDILCCKPQELLFDFRQSNNK